MARQSLASRMRERIVIERRGTGQDAYGETVETWTPQPSRAAAVIWGRGDERRAAAQDSGSQVATFVVRDDSALAGVTIRDRIAWNGIWEINGIARPKRGEAELTAVSAP